MQEYSTTVINYTCVSLIYICTSNKIKTYYTIFSYIMGTTLLLYGSSYVHSYNYLKDLLTDFNNMPLIGLFGTILFTFFDN